MLPESLGVVGLGAVGGSIAWSAVQHGVKQVIGYGFSPRDGVAAVKAGAITELASDFRRIVMRSELVVLATGPGRTMELLDRLAGLTIQGAYFTDVSPVKGPVVEKATRLGLSAWFAGSHPLAGAPTEGFESAKPDRIGGQVVYVTPLPGGAAAAGEVADFWERGVGAHPVTIAASVHDGLLARTSHLPHAVAAALAVALRRKGPKGATFGAGALDATKPARDEANLWAEVLTSNGNNLLDALEDVEEEIGLLKEALKRGDATAVRRWLDEAGAWRAGVEQ